MSVISLNEGARAYLQMCRFCLTSQAVLHAVEGLEGVAECGEYQYVEQQHPWQTHMDLVLKQVGKEKRVATLPSKPHEILCHIPSFAPLKLLRMCSVEDLLLVRNSLIIAGMPAVKLFNGCLGRE